MAKSYRLELAVKIRRYSSLIIIYPSGYDKVLCLAETEVPSFLIVDSYRIGQIHLGPRSRSSGVTRIEKSMGICTLYPPVNTQNFTIIAKDFIGKPCVWPRWSFMTLVLLIQAQAQTKAQAWKVVHFSWWWCPYAYFRTYSRTYKTNRSKSFQASALVGAWTWIIVRLKSYFSFIYPCPS